MSAIELMKKVFLLILLVVWTLVCFDALAQSWSFTNCSGDCLKKGVEAAGNTIGKSSGIITSKSLSRAIQDVIIYFLTFISLIAVIYVMWAGAQMLLFPANEESSEKTKKIIISVIIGIALIWFSWWIVNTLFYLLNSKQAVGNTWIPRAVAETQIRNVDFTTYSNSIRALKTRITGSYSPEVTSELNVLIDGAYDHLPDRADKYANKQLYDRVKKAIADYDLHREDIDRGVVEIAVDDFLEKAETFSIQGTLSATPRSGDAPLSVTLEGKNIIDSSGTTIPETNFTWWLRTPTGPMVLGRGKTINYTFKDEGTFTVYLTINSASKNSRGFTDVISFEDQVTVEVGQSKLKLLVYFNDQLATESVKIPTRESVQKVLIDPTQTKFASGYTITKTEWDFGNGKTTVREGPPIVEAQNYKEGEYTVKITLTRNDGEIFTRNILLKVWDPIASISVNNRTPNKGDTVIFQAKKVTQEGVTYLWEIRKFGVERPLFSATGPRMEFTFREVGQYSVGLVSAKGDTRDKETMEINIESRPPVVRFNADQLGAETPNIYILDGTSTYDPDYPDDQSLKYQWFINDKPAQLSETNSNNSRGEYTFPEIGVYQVELQVIDDQGKTASFKKTITIKSLLSIQLNIRPQVVKRGDKVIFSAIAPNAKIYEWWIGSKDVATTQSGRYVTSFDVSGTYPVSLKVTDSDNKTNSIQRKIYVVDGDAPFSVIQMSTKSLFTEVQQNACNGQEALVADRVTPVSLVGDKSINVGGKTTDLNYFWKVGLNASSTQKNFSHTFDELGCEEISLTVTDKKTGASHTTKEWVKIVNIPPKFSDIEVKVENVDQDPMYINLRMEWAKDPDGVIRSYTWYYYTSTDEQPQGFRITTKPETSFTLPKINGRYYFSVVLEDANGLRVDTRDISENTFSTPDLLVNQNISTPIIEFRASTTDAKYWDPVELTATAKNALGQDITKVVEYRWDVDGDGFYDIKTSENVLTYKYTVPGEYHPKVKATHRGLSTTKFVTINVTNRLIPQAQIQVIGDKIVAYNTSTGIVQSVSWFADDIKVSENKEYLLFTPNDGKFPKNIRLEISDGQDKQSVTVPVERNPQNKVLVRKTGRPLIVLTNENNSVVPAGEDVTWSDPVKPLFFYLGESEWAIQYYVIDNDVDVDTDLSGGKNDDADNRGTASYRLGRPYQVPLGTKRVTIMKFRLLTSDGKELDSRQIRVTRTFMAQVSDANIIGVAPSKNSQTFNLSKEDKARLDKLGTMIKNVSDEAVRKDLLRYIDQLGDIWYDRADRAETLLQFSRAVDGTDAVPSDLKGRILEQVNLIYTQWQEDAEERDLARTMLSDFLAKSPNKKEIFGDGTSENTGLLGQIIDSPEYYEQNKKITDRIFEEYVKFDTTLSDDAKSIIQEKLIFLTGTPSAVTPTTPEVPNITETEDGKGIIAKIKSLFSGLADTGNIFLWIGVIIVGLFGALFAWSKITHTKQVDEDIHEDKSPALNKENSSVWDNHTEVWHDQGTPDWLKSAESPFGSEDVLSKEVWQSQEPQTHTPEWMRDHEEKEVASIPSLTPIAPSTSEHSETTPDWLKDTTHEEKIPSTTPSWLTEEWPSETPEKTQKEETIVPKTAPISQDESHADIPEWLRWTETEETHEANNPKEEIPTSLPDEEKIQVPDSNVETNWASWTTVEIPDHDIPDWLKGSETSPETPEEKTPETSAWNESVADDNTVTTHGEEVSLPTPAPEKPKKTSKKKKETTKLLPEGDHLIGPAEDLLGDPSAQNQSTPS
jgi:Type IV secretion system pilin